MKLTERQNSIVRKMSRTLEDKWLEGTLTVQDVSLKDINELLASSQPDLSMLALYVLSELDKDKDIDVRVFNQDGESSRNYARYLLSEHKLEEAAKIIEDRGAPNALQHLESLAARTVASIASTTPAPAVNSMTIIIHGTWAATSTWWQKGENFWTYINNIRHDVYAGATPFSWSGQNSHDARVLAAEELKQWVDKNPSSALDIIAHSHGGNVCFLATHLGLEIRRLFLLGTPIRLEYFPYLPRICEIHNIFSTIDFVQAPAGTFPNCRGEGRTLADTNSVFNHRANDDGTGVLPGHSELHEPATWLASGLERLL